MLIKNYSSQIHKTPCYEPLNTTWPYQFKYKGLNCFFDPDILSPRTQSPSELQELFKSQEATLKKELNIYKSYKLLTAATIHQIEDQYTHLFFYEWYTYDKKSLLQESSLYQKTSQTYIEESPLDTEQTPEQEDELLNFIFQQNSKQAYIGISTQSIRNLTNYSYTVQLPWHPRPQKIVWQEEMLTDQSNILVIDGSRQMWKSFWISKLLIEESFVPWADILVAAFLQKTTNAILNYMRKFLTNFSEDDFTVYKKDGYIQNNASGTKIHFRTLSDEGKNVLGLTLRLIVIDEAQQVASSVFDEVLKPTMTTTGGRLILIGTAIEDTNSYMYETIIDIEKGQKYNNLNQKTARHIKVSADDNPLIHPLERKEIYDNRDKPSIQRQYFNRWGKWDDSGFNPKFVPQSQLPELSTEGHIIHAIDPARQKDRSAYAFWHALNNHLTIFVSWEVPEHLKKDWAVQAQYNNNLSTQFKKTFKSYSSVMDVTWVGDAVATIYRDNWFQITDQIRYTSGSTESEKMPWYYHVSKHVLLNNLLDMIEAGQITIIAETNTQLKDEIQYASIGENRFWTLFLESKFFDDIINTVMIMAYISKKNRYLYRTSLTQTEAQKNNDLFREEMKLYKQPSSKPKKSSGNW